MSTLKQGALFDLEPEDLKPRKTVLSRKELKAESLARIAEMEAVRSQFKHEQVVNNDNIMVDNKGVTA